MKSGETQDVSYNLALFKRLRYYHAFDPNSPKIFNYNVYRFTLMVLCAILISINLYAMLGLIVKTDDTVDEVGIVLVLFAHMHFFLCVIKVSTCLYHADKIWDLLDVTRINFVQSKACLKHVKILYEHRDTSVKIINIFYNCIICTLFCWTTIYPLLFNRFMAISAKDGIRRYGNVINLRFPVTTNVYNDYYLFFYGIEVFTSIYAVYMFIFIHTLLISISYTLMAQCKMHTLAFENIGQKQEYENENTEDYSQYLNDFKSIVTDQQKHNLKLNAYYSIGSVFIIVNFTVASISIIMLTYTFIVIYTALESLSFFNLSKLLVPYFLVIGELYIYCFLLDNIRSTKESVNFGIYCCNWTNLDLKFKKLLLLTMWVNDANRRMIKISPRRIINLNLFANVIMTCINVISVLVKITQNKHF